MSQPRLQDRRAVISALGVALATPARADIVIISDPPLFAGALANNRTAIAFRKLPVPVELPDVKLEGRTRSFAAYRGKVLLLSLWAEWCAPCLVELPALDILWRRHTTRRFEIVPLLTGSKIPTQTAERVLRKAGATGMPMLRDASPDGKLLMDRLTRNGSGPPSLPCNLLVDAKGIVRGRSLGTTEFAKDLAALRAGKETDSERLIARLAQGHPLPGAAPS